MEEKSSPSNLAVASIHKLLNFWNTKYSYTVFESPLLECEDTLEFQAVLSKPTKAEPVAPAVVNVFFIYSKSQENILGYRIEYEQVEHWLTDKVPFHECWLDRVVRNKLRVGKRFQHIVNEAHVSRPNTAQYSEYSIGSLPSQSKSAYSRGWAEDSTYLSASEVEEIKSGCMMEMMKQSSRSLYVDPSEADGEATEEQQRQDFEKALADIRDFETELIRRFKGADHDDNGVLDSNEFFRILKDCGLRFTREELFLLMGEADENADGQVDYTEFVPVAVELLQVITNAQFAIYEAAERESHIQDEELREISSADLTDALVKIDSKIAAAAPDSVKSGLIARRTLRQCLGDRRNGLLREEMNMCMGEVPMDDTDPSMVRITELHDIIREVRMRTVRLMIQRQTASDTELYLLQQLEETDRKTNGNVTGWLSISQLRDVLLYQSPQILVTRVQAFGIVGEAEVDPKTNLVDYRKFSGIASYILDQMFDPRALKERHELARRADIQPVELLGGRGKKELEEELKQLFLRHDENQNGTLDHEEFVECIDALELDLPSNYVRALLVVADGDSSGDVDYEEFTEFAYEYLLHLVRERAIKEIQEGRKSLSKIRKLSLTMSTKHMSTAQ